MQTLRSLRNSFPPDARWRTVHAGSFTLFTPAAPLVAAYNIVLSPSLLTILYSLYDTRNVPLLSVLVKAYRLLLSARGCHNAAEPHADRRHWYGSPKLHVKNNNRNFSRGTLYNRPLAHLTYFTKAVVPWVTNRKRWLRSLRRTVLLPYVQLRYDEQGLA
jgi:hypothetical protein